MAIREKGRRPNAAEKAKLAKLLGPKAGRVSTTSRASLVASVLALHGVSVAQARTATKAVK